MLPSWLEVSEHLSLLCDELFRRMLIGALDAWDTTESTVLLAVCILEGAMPLPMLVPQHPISAGPEHLRALVMKLQPLSSQAAEDYSLLNFTCLLKVQDGQVCEGVGHIRMIRPIVALPDRQCTLIQGLRKVPFPRLVVQDGQVAQVLCHLHMHPSQGCCLAGKAGVGTAAAWYMLPPWNEAAAGGSACEVVYLFIIWAWPHACACACVCGFGWWCGALG